MGTIVALIDSGMGLDTVRQRRRSEMSEANKAVVKRFYEEVMNRKNVAAIDELCSPDFVDHTAFPGQQPGRQGMKDSFATFLGAFSDLRVNVEAMIAEGDLVATRFVVSATHTGELMGAAPTGKKVFFHGIDMIRVVNGKAVEAWHQGDDIVVLAELGARPRP